MTDPAAVGERVLAGLEAGRAKAHAARRAEAERNRLAVLDALNRDIVAGHSARGRAGRIQRALRRQGLTLSDRTVRKNLYAFSYAASLPAQDGPIEVTQAAK